MKKNYFKILSFFAGVVDTADKHSFANISKKFEMVLMGYSGARGTLIYEKNLMSKISCYRLLTTFTSFVKKQE